MKTPETDPNIAPKLCAKPGCATPLGPKNRSGKCDRHFHWKAPAERSSSSDDGSAIGVIAKAIGVEKIGDAGKNGANGHAIGDDQVTSARKNGSNGAAAVAGEFLEERLNILLLNLPAVDKSRIAEKWLRGEL